MRQRLRVESMGATARPKMAMSTMIAPPRRPAMMPGFVRAVLALQALSSLSQLLPHFYASGQMTSSTIISGQLHQDHSNPSSFTSVCGSMSRCSSTFSSTTCAEKSLA